MMGIRMTASMVRLRSPARATRHGGVRADPLAAALLGAAVAGLVALCVALAAAAPRDGVPSAPRVALVVDAGGRQGAALAAARTAADRSHGARVAIRVPRSAVEAEADVRYFAAQGYGTVVVVGPVARAAAREAARAYPRTRFVPRARGASRILPP
jgi:basic membrane lipoprotein Med (substrate-binding protein (PBP1-ABC) superfamily)